MKSWCLEGWILLKFLTELLGSSSCFYQGVDEIFLVFKWLMLESESRGLNLTLIVEYDIKRVLLTTDTILLAALTINLNLNKKPHLIIKRKIRCGI